MIIEIVEFYPSKRKGVRDFIGTIHAYVVIDSIEFDLRGIQVFNRKGKIFIWHPSFTVFEEGEKLKVPYFSLTVVMEQKEMIKQIVDKGIKYVKEYYNESKERKIR